MYVDCSQEEEGLSECSGAAADSDEKCLFYYSVLMDSGFKTSTSACSLLNWCLKRN